MRRGGCRKPPTRRGRRRPTATTTAARRRSAPRSRSRKPQRLLQNSQSAQAGQNVKDLQRQAEELAKQQREYRKQVAGLDSGRRAAPAAACSSSSQTKDEMRGKVGEIEQQLEQPLAAVAREQSARRGPQAAGSRRRHPRRHAEGEDRVLEAGDGRRVGVLEADRERDRFEPRHDEAEDRGGGGGRRHARSRARDSSAPSDNMRTSRAACRRSASRWTGSRAAARSAGPGPAGPGPKVGQQGQKARAAGPGQAQGQQGQGRRGQGQRRQGQGRRRQGQQAKGSTARARAARAKASPARVARVRAARAKANRVRAKARVSRAQGRDGQGQQGQQGRHPGSGAAAARALSGLDDEPQTSDMGGAGDSRPGADWRQIDKLGAPARERRRQPSASSCSRPASRVQRPGSGGRRAQGPARARQRQESGESEGPAGAVYSTAVDKFKALDFAIRKKVDTSNEQLLLSGSEDIPPILQGADSGGTHRVL